MKPWRVILLVLLMLLLPLRGAVAAAMLCPSGSHGEVLVQVAQDGHAHGDDAAHSHAHAHAHADHAQEPHAGTASDASPTHSDTCHVCAGFCSVTPLLAAMPVVAQPLEAATLSFPDWSAPATVFLSDGQERPPRSS